MQSPVTETQIENCVYGQMICPKTVHMEARLYARLLESHISLWLIYKGGRADGPTVGRSVTS